MPTTRQLKESQGAWDSVSECPPDAEGGVFRYSRIERPEAVPAADDRLIDVAVLDMHHGLPNLGHDCVVRDILDAACDLEPALRQHGLAVRALSYDVRRGLVIPEAPGRVHVYVGTGGPGHLDPKRNDGTASWSQGVREDPSWEAPYFALLDAISGDESAVFLGICHSFGMLCRWSGAATVVLRGDEKGGKSTGLLENWLTPHGREHPWFRRFSAELPDGGRHRVMDNRLFDLLASPSAPRHSVLAVEDAGGRPGDAVTMMEFARDNGGVMPRILGVNHHPEIVNRERQRQVLEQKRARGEVSETWYRERLEALTVAYAGEDSDRRSRLTSEFTMLLPLRFYITREVRRRAEALGKAVDFHENGVVDSVVGSTIV